jgi:hypothetical protein
MRNFWWGVALGALIGVILLAPDSEFSFRIRELFATLTDSVVAILVAAGDATIGLAEDINGGY